jgi:TPR repeat protein
MKRAAEAGDPVANVGMAAYHEKGIGVPRDMKAAEEYLRQGALLGSTLAQVEIGEWQARLSRLDKGANPEEGLKWLDRAWSQGKSFYSLANAMLLHLDAPRGSTWRNHPKAFEMNKGCIEFKFARCHSYMGFLMEYGEGVNRDPMRAFAYYDVARALGSNVTRQLERLEKQLTSNEIASARDLSQALQKRLKDLPAEIIFQPPSAN